MTNYERIKSMSLEELAEELKKIRAMNCWDCRMFESPDFECFDCLETHIMWLKESVEEVEEDVERNVLFV